MACGSADAEYLRPPHLLLLASSNSQSLLNLHVMTTPASAVTPLPNGTRGAAWAADGEERADYIEVFQDPLSSTNRLEKDHLCDKPDNLSIKGWLDKQRTFSETRGGLRMIILDRHRYDIEFPITEDRFSTILDSLNLSKRTRQSFDCDAGTFSRFYRFDDEAKMIAIGKLCSPVIVATVRC